MKKIITAVLAMVLAVTVSAVLPARKAEAETGVTMYRMYNPNSGEHFYTSSTEERLVLINAGWRYEGIGWYAPSEGDPVYRLYNASGGEHHYTPSEEERDMLTGAGWNYEGIGWYSDPEKRVPLYREYNPNQFSCNHNYTTSPDEHSTLIRAGWKDEGIGWYGIGEGQGLSGNYYIKVNRAANTVTVYVTDLRGYPAEPVKAMVCSTGTATPLGTYSIYNWRKRWNALFGGVWGQYSSGIVGDILFHSVPYYSASVSDLEYLEYNKLGTAASMGCIRLCVADAKWIFDFCPIGTTVYIYDDAANPGPLGKPESIHIDPSDWRRGWDPTDPDPRNPW